MQSHLQRLEIQRAVLHDHQLAVEHAALRKLRLDRRDQLREVTVEWFLVAALDEHFVAVAKDERAESVPLGLEDPSFTGRQLANSVGEHRQHWRINRKIHPRSA